MTPSCFTLDWAGWYDVATWNEDESDEAKASTRIFRAVRDGNVCSVKPVGDEFQIVIINAKTADIDFIQSGTEADLLEYANAYAERNRGWA